MDTCVAWKIYTAMMLSNETDSGAFAEVGVY